MPKIGSDGRRRASSTTHRAQRRQLSWLAATMLLATMVMAAATEMMMTALANLDNVVVETSTSAAAAAADVVGGGNPVFHDHHHHLRQGIGSRNYDTTATRRALRAAANSSSQYPPPQSPSANNNSSSNPFDRARVVSCKPTAYNGTVVGDDGCVVQSRATWVSPDATGVETVMTPSESDCCALCRTKAPPNIDAPPERACAYTFCEVGPGIGVPGHCDDGFGNKMIDGECRMALLTLPLDAQPVPPSGGTFPRPSANLVSGTPASSFILGFKSAPPPKGYRAVGPVRVPGIFNGGCSYSTDDLLRKSVSKPACIANVSSPDEAARICRSMKGCTAVSWYPSNGIPVLRAFTTPSAFRDVNNPDFGALAPGQRKANSRLNSIAVFKYGAIDKRCLTPSPYSFLYVQMDAPRPPDLRNSPFEEQEEAMAAARRIRFAGIATGIAVGGAAVAAVVAGVAFFVVRERRKKRELETEKGGGDDGGGLLGGGTGTGTGNGNGGGGGSGGGSGGGNITSAFAAAAGANNAGTGKAPAAGAAAAAAAATIATTKSAAARSSRLYSKQSSLEKLVRVAAVRRRARNRVIAEAGAAGGDFNNNGGDGDFDCYGDDSDDSDLEEWELNLSEIEIMQRPGEDGEDAPWILGSGVSGNVYRGRLNGLQDVAVKIFLDQFHDEHNAAAAAAAAALDSDSDDSEDGDANDGGGGVSGGEDDGGAALKPGTKPKKRTEAELEARRARRRAEAVERAEAAAKKRHDALRREVVILKSLRDPNIVRFIGANVRRGTTVLVTEWCPRGDLYRALARDCGGSGGGGGGGAGRFSWSPSYVKVNQETRRRPGTGLNWTIAADVGRGLAYLHSRGIVHLDVKSPNLLLSDSWRALIADVGLARVLKLDDEDEGEDGAEKSKKDGEDAPTAADKNSSPSVLLRPTATATATSAVSGAGTFAWAAPELLLARRVDEKADIYSFGVVLWELSTREPPPATRRLRALEVPEEAPAAVSAMIDRCLDEDPRKRPTARELVDFFVRGLAELDASSGVRSAAAMLARTSAAVGVGGVGGAGSGGGGGIGGIGSGDAGGGIGIGIGSGGGGTVVAEPIGFTLARVSRAASASVAAALSEEEMFALPPGGGAAGLRIAAARKSSGGGGGGNGGGSGGVRSGGGGSGGGGNGGSSGSSGSSGGGIEKKGNEANTQKK